MPILRSLQEIGQEVRGAATGASRRQTGNTWSEQCVEFQAGSFCLGFFYHSWVQNQKQRGICARLDSKKSMFDCMEALGLAPRPLFDVSGQGSCMLSKATPYFSGLDPFAWAGAGSVQCEYSALSIKCSRVCVLIRVLVLLS